MARRRSRRGDTRTPRCRSTRPGDGPGEQARCPRRIGQDVRSSTSRAGFRLLPSRSACCGRKARQHRPAQVTLVSMAQRASSGRLDAMVLDADERQSLVTVRSLGRTGLRVGAFDDTPYPPAATSRWCSARRRLPDGADSWRYLDAVLDLVHRHRPRVVFSARDSTIEALRERRAEIERETMLALAAEPALEIAVSKERTLALAQRLGIPVPLSVPIADPGAAADATVRTGLPAVVKPVRSWVQPADGAGRRLSCVVVTNGPEARRATEAAMRAGGQVLLQEWLR